MPGRPAPGPPPIRRGAPEGAGGAARKPCRMPYLELHVAPGGDDGAPGTRDRPLASLAGARDALRAARRTLAGPAPPATVWVHAGVHRLAEPLSLTAEDSDTAYAAWPCGPAPTISAGVPVRGAWEPHRGGILRCRPEGLPEGLRPTQLFAGGRRQVRARFPNAADGELPLRGADAWPHRELQFDPAALGGRTWDRPGEAVLHCFTRHRWGNLQWRVAALDAASGRLTLAAGGWQMGTTFQRADGGGVGAGSRFFVENVFEELDSPGEWYFDREAGLLYFWPPEGLRLSGCAAAELEFDGLACAALLRGTRHHPVRGVRLAGLRIAGTAATYLEPYEEPSLGDWAIHRGGAVCVEGAVDCAVEDCLFDEVGGNAVFVGGYAARVRVTGNTIRRAGDSGVCLVGRSHLRPGASHRCPHCGAEHRWDWDPEPSEDVPSDCEVGANRIEGIGVFGKQTAGVFLALARRVRIAHNRIERVPRAAVCFNDGVFGGHVVEWNDVRDTVRETGDHGPFNAWGRDRHWCRAQSHGPESHPPCGDVRRDARETTVIRHNRFTDRRGWGIDLDDGASNYHVHSNLCLGVAVKLREGDLRIVENNVFVEPANPPGLHVGYEGNADRFEGNVVVLRVAGAAPPPPAGAPERDIDFVPPQAPSCYQVIYPPRRGPIAGSIDRNVIWDGRGGFAAHVQPRGGGPAVVLGLEEWRELGFDRHSRMEDPGFVDAAAGDFRLRPDSPAVALGFRAWDIGAVGLPPTFREWPER